MKDIHQKKLQKVRMYRATHLFYETPQGDDEQGEIIQGECSRAVRNAVYPSIGGEKGNLNSAVYDQDSSQDVISLSCFTRPLPKTVRIESTKATDSPLISHEAMLRMGYNMKMIPKQKSDRTKEISEIESIQRELVKNDIFIANQTLQKAILYENERDTSPKKLG